MDFAVDACGQSDAGHQALKDFIAYAKANPSKLTVGSAGVGSITHLAIALFMHEAGIELTHVPYHSTSESLPALMAGQIDALFGDTPIVASQIKAGTIIGIAVAAKKRETAIPDVPTMAEAGQQNVEAASWFGFVASAKTPAPIVKRLQDAMSAAQKDPDYLTVLAKQGANFGEPGPDAYAKIIKTDAVKWKTVIDEAGIKPIKDTARARAVRQAHKERRGLRRRPRQRPPPPPAWRDCPPARRNRRSLEE